MFVAVPDAALCALLASPALLSRAWPGAELEVMTLLQVLRVAEPSLVEVLAIGLVAMVTPVAETGSTVIRLVHKRAVLTAAARCRATGERVASPHTRLQEVTMLEVRDLVVEGRSGLRKIG